MLAYSLQLTVHHHGNPRQEPGKQKPWRPAAHGLAPMTSQPGFRYNPGPPTLIINRSSRKCPADPGPQDNVFAPDEHKLTSTPCKTWKEDKTVV